MTEDELLDMTTEAARELSQHLNNAGDVEGVYLYRMFMETFGEYLCVMQRGLLERVASIDKGEE